MARATALVVYNKCLWFGLGVGRIPSRHGPAKKPAEQRKQGEANRGGGRESKNLGAVPVLGVRLR
ncbi:BQ5605_C010g06038 [Microbotryum silenes-dioicae]|uniref:BQ5605_C010g06038 protein n=1 Tax=Microbotryum silenes-dioicae TaxID=796604 RepID=A0A2X0LTP5_9BASI|nr:BQ5605_C010g06038 [Microbotryum silenes-dioicae]